MALFKLAILTSLTGALLGNTLFAQNRITQPVSVQTVALNYYDNYYSLDDSKEETSPSDKEVAPAPEVAPAGDAAACASGASVECCCPAPASCDSSCCDLGDAWTLMGHLHPCGAPAITAAGWVQFGYTNESTGLFNSHPNRFNNHQSWVYVEKEADAGDGTWDWGFRFDALYGVDAQDTQSFGNPPGNWDFANGFDHGIYGWALPQLYVDLAYGDWNVRLGHFYTTIGYEVVPAPQNFFYSHAMTMYLSEPFTHTGVLASYEVDDDVTLYGGWTLGWDTGFDQSDQGNNFLGGFAVPVLDDATFTYMLTGGNLGARGRDAYTHSLVLDLPLTERLTYVAQSDVLRVDSTGEDNIGINQYLFWKHNECVAVGARVEWWKGDSVTDFDYDGQIGNVPVGSHSYYEATFGLNLRPHANLVFRPEIRYDWAPFADYDQTIFGIDMVATF